jgi:hypothetical protein
MWCLFPCFFSSASVLPYAGIIWNGWLTAAQISRISNDISILDDMNADMAEEGKRLAFVSWLLY